MAKSSVMVSLPQMIDLALNSPEVGAINFNILHALLHVIVQQLDLLETKVEFRGNDGERLQTFISSGRPSPVLSLTEYTLTESKDKGASKAKGKKQKSDADTDTRKSTDSLVQTVVVVEPTAKGTGPHVSVAIDKKEFERLEHDVKSLRKELEELREMPSNTGLIHAIRSQTAEKGSPVLDMFQVLTLSKRIDVVETGLGKLGSMVEDLARETTKEKEEVEQEANSDFVIEAIEDLKERVNVLENRATTTEDFTMGVDQSPNVTADRTEKEEPQPQGREHKVIEETVLKTVASKASGSQNLSEGSIKGRKQIKSYDEDIGNLRNELQKLIQKNERINQMLFGGAEGASTSPIALLENKINENDDRLKSLDEMLNNELDVFRSKITQMETEIGEIAEKMHLCGGVGGLGGGGMDSQDATEILNKITNLQEGCDNLEKMIAKLNEDKQQKQVVIDTMMEQIELLKTIKANREDLEDALADKADSCAVNRKVSHDQFDAICDDLNRGIEGMISKLHQQESVWEQTLSDIQKEIGSKLNKMDLDPLQEFVSKKITMLQKKLKALSALKKETEAAGTKSKLLRDVNCISCDKDVVMRKEVDPSTYPQQTTLPPAKSMGPYLAYELDALRKQQKCASHSRNLNHFENALTSRVHKGDHLCNRYCGGSHTVTTPQQRVTRLGHFMQQWGNQNDSIPSKLERQSITVQPETISEPNTNRSIDGTDLTARHSATSKPLKTPERGSIRVSIEMRAKSGKE